MADGNSAAFLGEQILLCIPSVIRGCEALPTDEVFYTAAFQLVRDDLVNFVRRDPVRVGEYGRLLRRSALRKVLTAGDVFPQV